MYFRNAYFVFVKIQRCLFKERENSENFKGVFAIDKDADKN